MTEPPILVCTPNDLRTPDAVDGTKLVVVTATSPVADIQENLDVNEHGFDPAADPVDEQAAEAFRAVLAGCAAITVRWNGIAVCAGMHLPVRGEAAELTGITTLDEYRNRGFAAIATAALAQLAFESGAGHVFLSTDNPVARRLYERLGFTSP
jgi:predicted GNAT family acetyltransferase